MNQASEMKLKVRISLLPFLEKLMQEIQAPPPEVTVKNIPHSKKIVVISFDVTKIACPIIAGVPKDQPIFHGEDRLNPRVAEHRAVMSVVQYLEKTHGVLIHDMSRSEIITYEEKFNHVLSCINSSLPGYNFFLNEYQSSIGHLDRFLSNPSLNRINTTLDICKSLSDLRLTFQVSAASIIESFANLSKEIELYSTIGSSTATADPSKGRGIVISISEKEILAEYMKFFDLPAPKYSTSVTENDLFIGTCSIHVGPCSGPDPSGRSHISGDAKSGPAEAECSAAAKAIYFLQRFRNIEIVDFNYDSLVVLRQKFDNLLALRSQYELLVSKANTSWSEFCGTLDSIFKKLSDLSEQNAISTDQSSEFHGRFSFHSELEAAISVIKDMHRSALPFIASIFD